MQPAIARLQRASSPLDTPTPPSSTSLHFANLPTSIRPLHHRKPSMPRGPVHSVSRPAPMPDTGEISLDGTERDRRSLEDQVRRGLGPTESTEPLGDPRLDQYDDGFGFDEHSPKYGASPRRRPYDGRTHHSDTSDVSMQILLDHEQKQRRPPPPADVTDDLSSISFARTLSPHRRSPQALSHASPLSGFDGMAAELRKEFERITNAASKAKAVKLGSVADQAGTARRVFGEIGNTFISSPTRTSKQTTNTAGFSVQEGTWPLPPAPAPSRFEPSVASQQQPLSRPAPAPAPCSAPPPRPAPPPPAPSTARRPAVSFSPPRRPTAPTPSRSRYPLPDVTGITDGLASPEKPRTHRAHASAPRSHPEAGDPVLEEALEQLQDRINSLEDANASSADRVRELERSVGDHDSGIGSGESLLGAGKAAPYRGREPEIRGELEDLVKRLRAHVGRLQRQIDAHSAAIDQLRADRRRGSSDDIVSLRDALEALTAEVDEVRSLVEALADDQGRNQRPAAPRRPAPPAATRSAPGRLFAPAPRRERARERDEVDDIDREIRRANEILGDAQRTCADCRRRVSAPSSAPIGGRRRAAAPTRYADDEGYVGEDEDEGAEVGLPPQTVLARMLADLEASFASHRAIFIELSDAYKAMDPAANAAKRRILANHLRESIDVLEAKADEIKRLYDMLHYRDHPKELPSFVLRHQQRRTPLA